MTKTRNIFNKTKRFWPDLPFSFSYLHTDFINGPLFENFKCKDKKDAQRAEFEIQSCILKCSSIMSDNNESLTASQRK